MSSTACVPVALLVPNCNTGGTERVCQRLANYLTDLGHPVLVISMANKSFAFPLTCSYAKLDEGLPNGRLKRWFHRLRTLKLILDKHRITAILSMGEYPNVLVACLPDRFRRINRYTNSFVSLTGFKGCLLRQALRFAHYRVDLTIVPVLRLATELGLQRRGNKVIEIPNPLDLAEICRQGTIQLNYAELIRGPFFLHVGQLVNQKDHDSLLHAYYRYRIEGGRVRLMLLGRGERREAIQNLIERLGLADSVKLVGWVDNPLIFMSQATALIMTSRWEGTPNVMIEAMALGCPVISTDCPTGPSEILQGGVAGRLVPPGDVVALAFEMHLMGCDESWRAEWREKALRRADDYSIIRIGPHLIRAIVGNYV